MLAPGLDSPSNPVFLTYVASTTITFSFVEQFWIQTDAEDELFDQDRIDRPKALSGAVIYEVRTAI